MARKMCFEGETVFVNKYGTRYRRCEKTDCIWNADCNELSTGGIMSGKIHVPRFKIRVCNCSAENPIAILEALKVSCYPIEERINGDHTNLEFIRNLREQQIQ